MRGAQDKGGDVRMTTDMVKLAWVDNYDVAVLVSSDADFVPVAEFLDTCGIKMIHGAFPPKGCVFRSTGTPNALEVGHQSVGTGTVHVT